jgi:hypothetical protein
LPSKENYSSRLEGKLTLHWVIAVLPSFNVETTILKAAISPICPFYRHVLELFVFSQNEVETGIRKCFENWKKKIISTRPICSLQSQLITLIVYIIL